MKSFKPKEAQCFARKLSEINSDNDWRKAEALLAISMKESDVSYANQAQEAAKAAVWHALKNVEREIREKKGRGFHNIRIIRLS